MSRDDETRGDRIYLVRKALGKGRKPLPAAEFVARVSRHLSQPMSRTRLSRLENDHHEATLDELEALAAVDPLQRGIAWLVFRRLPAAYGGPHLTQEEILRQKRERHAPVWPSPEATPRGGKPRRKRGNG